MKSKKCKTTIEDVVHFFEVEIRKEEEYLQNTPTPYMNAFDGIYLDDKTAGKKLHKSHIRFCKDIIERIKGGNL